MKGKTRSTVANETTTILTLTDVVSDDDEGDVSGKYEYEFRH